MGFTESIKSVFGNYLTFSGRASRSEFWWWTLFYILVIVFLVLVAGGTGFGLALLIIFLLGTFLPNLAVTIRRLHDANNSGWLYLISLVPYVGGLILLVLCALKGTEGPNNYGPDPLAENHIDETVFD